MAINTFLIFIDTIIIGIKHTKKFLITGNTMLAIYAPIIVTNMISRLSIIVNFFLKILFKANTFAIIGNKK